MSSSDYNKIISTINSVSSNYSYSPDPDNLICIDSSNNRIGINTLNPGEAIDISGGNIRAKDFIFTEPSNNSLKELLNNKAPISNPSFTGIISANDIDVSGAIKTYKYDDIYKQLGQTITNTTTNSSVGSYITTNYEGNIIAIGSNAGYQTGIIRIYKYNDISWVQISQNITPGQSVSLNSSGTIIAIGEHSFSSATGKVEVYRYVNDNSWIQISQTILGLDINDYFGYSTSINSAGTIVAIGSTNANTTNGTGSGSVSVYKHIIDGSWVRLGQTINGEGPNDQCGWSVSLDASGTKVAIGAFQNRNPSGMNSSGHVRIYRYTNDVSWVLISQDIDGTTQYDSFGYSVSLNGDGTLVACGATGNMLPTPSTGHVKVYEYISDGSWIPQGQTISGEALNDYSGYSVSLNKQGNILAIGAPYNDGSANNAGHVKIYKYNGVSWIQIDTDIDGDLANERLGHSVALNGLGNRLAVGAPGGYNSSGYSGFVKVYQLTYLTQTATSNILPLANNTYTLGSSSLYWSNAYIRDVSISNIDVSGNIVPLRDASSSLGSSSLYWSNAYIRDVSISNIDVSGNIVPLRDASSSLGSSLKRWSNVYINDLSVNTINGLPYNGSSGGGSSTVLTSITSNIVPSTTNTYSLGSSGLYWSNSYIRDVSISNIDVSGNIVPLRDVSSNLGSSLKRWRNIFVNDLSVNTINGQAYSAGGGGGTTVLTSVTSNIVPSTTNTYSLGSSSQLWKNGYFTDMSVSNIDVSRNIKFATNTVLITPTANITAQELSQLSGVSSSIQTQLNNKAPKNDAQFTGSTLFGGNTSFIGGANSFRNQITAESTIFATTIVPIIPYGIYTAGSIGSSLEYWATGYIDTMYVFRLYVSGVGVGSDDRVKHNEVIINNGLDIIERLTPKFYQKTLTLLDASYNGDLSGHTWTYESGLIAQELLQISDLSFVVSGGDYYDSSNNLIKETYRVNYNSVFVYGLAAIKELHQKVKTQETTILSLQTALLEQQTTILSLQTAMLEQKTLINNIILAQGQNQNQNSS